MGTSLLAPLRGWDLQRFVPSFWAKKQSSTELAPNNIGFSNPNRDPHGLHQAEPTSSWTDSVVRDGWSFLEQGKDWALENFRRIGDAVNFRDRQVAKVLDTILDPNTGAQVLNEVEAKFYLGDNLTAPSKKFFALDNVHYQKETIAVTEASGKASRQLQGYLLTPTTKADLAGCSSLCTILHGIRSGLDHNLDLVQKLLDKGNAVFIANYAGFPDNPIIGYPTKTSLVEDAQAILKHSSKLANGLPLKVITHSLGSAIATKALVETFSQEKLNPRLNITGLTLVSAWDSFDGLLDSMLANNAKPQDPHLAALVGYAKSSDEHRIRVKQATSKITESYWNTGANVQALLDLNARRPRSQQIKTWTVIHGENDPVVPIDLAKSLAQRIQNHWSVSNNCHFIPVKNAEHFQSNGVPAEFL